MITSGAKYKLLIDRCALRPLESEEDLDAALDMQLELMEKLSALEAEEKDYLKVLGTLIQAYEAVHHNLDDIPEGTPAELLCWLMEVNDLKQSDLCKLLGVTSGRASELANGVRDMSKNQILILAERFHVTPGLFLAKKPTPTPWRTASKTNKKKAAPRRTGGKFERIAAKSNKRGTVVGKVGGAKTAAVVIRSGSTGKATKTTMGPSPAKKKSKRA